MTPQTHSSTFRGSGRNGTEEHLSSDNASAPGSNFECSICLELSQDPVVTMCGHLFCGSCLHRWITVHSTLHECPVCKAFVKDKIIPLYGKGRGGVTDSNAKIVYKFNPPRPPPAQRNYDAAPRFPSSPEARHHSFISRENYIGRGGNPTYSAVSFGLFPALLGIHMVSLPESGSRFSSGSAFNASFRLPPVGHMTSQQQRLSAAEEFILYWFFIILACFAVLCLLLF